MPKCKSSPFKIDFNALLQRKKEIECLFFSRHFHISRMLYCIYYTYSYIEMMEFSFTFAVLLVLITMVTFLSDATYKPLKAFVIMLGKKEQKILKCFLTFTLTNTVRHVINKPKSSFYASD